MSGKRFYVSAADSYNICHNSEVYRTIREHDAEYGEKKNASERNGRALETFGGSNESLAACNGGRIGSNKRMSARNKDRNVGQNRMRECMNDKMVAVF